MKRSSITLVTGDIIPVFSDEGYLAEFNIVNKVDVADVTIRIHVSRWVKGSDQIRPAWFDCGIASEQTVLELKHHDY